VILTNYTVILTNYSVILTNYTVILTNYTVILTNNNVILTNYNMILTNYTVILTNYNMKLSHSYTLGSNMSLQYAFVCYNICSKRYRHVIIEVNGGFSLCVSKVLSPSVCEYLPQTCDVTNMYQSQYM